MQNTILVITIFAILLKGMFMLAAKTMGGDDTQLMNICNIIIAVFAFIGLYCQWIWQYKQFKLKGEQ